jgi:hypothetical protein
MRLAAISVSAVMLGFAGAACAQDEEMGSDCEEACYEAEDACMQECADADDPDACEEACAQESEACLEQCG